MTLVHNQSSLTNAPEGAPVDDAGLWTSAAAVDPVAAVGQVPAVPKILEVICRTTGLGFAAVARVTETRWIACAVRDEIAFGLLPGGELTVETTICDEIRASGNMVVIDHVDADPRFCSHHTPARYGFQSYISVPIVLADGTFFGTLCAIDPKPAVLNTPATVDMFTLFAQLIALHLDAFTRVARLEGLVSDRTAALSHLNAALQREMAITQADGEALRALTERLECLREEQRTAIARELHDEFGQSLTALKLDLAAVRKLFRDGGGAATDDVLTRVNRMEIVVERALDDIERIVADLRPTVLDVLGCIPAAEWLLAQFEDRTAIRTSFDADRALDVAPDLGTALFRILQETLTNVSRHAAASHVDVTLRRDGLEIILRVADDGRGLTAADRLKPSAFGLRGVAERARAFHGTMCLETPQAGGLTVVVRFPAGAAAQ